MSSTEESIRLFRIRKNILEMLRDRNYDIADSDLAMDLKEFRERFGGESIRRDDLAFVKEKRGDPSDRILVMFSSSDKDKIGVDQIRKCVTRMKDDGLSHAVLVIKEGITPSAKTAILDGEVAKRYRVEAFKEAELLVNVNRHMLVPEHQVLNDKEKKALLERYHLKEIQLPRIQPSDPIAKYHGLRRGQVVKIIRPSETAGRYITYRFVV